jgi:hypothetical protein
MWVGKNMYSSRNGHPEDAAVSRKWFKGAANLGESGIKCMMIVFFLP